MDKPRSRVYYKIRKIDKFIKWSIDSRGFVKWRELVEIQDKYNVKVH